MNKLVRESTKSVMSVQPTPKSIGLSDFEKEVVVMQKDSVSDNEREQEISNLKIGVSEFEVQKQV